MAVYIFTNIAVALNILPFFIAVVYLSFLFFTYIGWFRLINMD